MPVKYFVSKDSQGRQWPPDTSDESKKVVEIIKRVYSAYNDSEHLYAIVANLHIPDAYADLVVITEHGMGFIELKGNYGKIYQQGVYWYAGTCTEPIKAGSQNTPARNPHEQVRAYAETIRKKLLTPLLGVPWLPGNSDDWKKFKFSTAVCFTNREADIEEFKNIYHSHPRKQEWESHADIILAPADIPEWIYTLKFEASFPIKKGSHYDYEPYTLDAEQIVRISTYLLGATEWTEIDQFMPDGKPYAYLLLHQEGKIECLPLTNDIVTIGRNPDTCDIIIPDHFLRVSGSHAQIIRYIEGIFIKDLKSRNGTFINGKPIQGEQQLQPGHKMTLGGRTAKGEVYLLELSFTPIEVISTNVGTQV